MLGPLICSGLKALVAVARQGGLVDGNGPHGGEINLDRYLVGRAGFAPKEVAQVFVAGVLGAALPPEMLKRVALLPEPMLDKNSLSQTVCWRAYRSIWSLQTVHSDWLI